MILKPASFNLNGVLEKNDTYLPLAQADMSRLVALVPDGEEMILTLQDNLYTEWVRVYNECGTILVERGLDCEARKFPRGTCLFFEMSLPLVKWLVCNLDCCEGDDCDCTVVSLDDASLPGGIVNQEWAGSLSFGGTLPINIKLLIPDWMSAEVQDGVATLSGTPTEAGIVEVGYSATNCRGVALVADTLEFQVFEVATGEG